MPQYVPGLAWQRSREPVGFLIMVGNLKATRKGSGRFASLYSTQGITMNEPSPKRNVSVKQTLTMLKENGVEINEKEAEKVLDLMYFLAKLIVNQNFKK